METFPFMKSPPGEKFVDLCCALYETRSPPKQQWLQETRESSVLQYGMATMLLRVTILFSREIFSQEFPPSLARYRWKQRVQGMEDNPSSSAHSDVPLTEGAKRSDSSCLNHKGCVK